MLDTRRTRDYDADGLVDQYLNIKEVQVAIPATCTALLPCIQKTTRVVLCLSLVLLAA